MSSKTLPGRARRAGTTSNFVKRSLVLRYVLRPGNVPSCCRISAYGPQASESCGSSGVVGRIEEVHRAKETCCDRLDRAATFDGCLQSWNRHCAYVSFSHGRALHHPGGEC